MMREWCPVCGRDVPGVYRFAGDDRWHHVATYDGELRPAIEHAWRSIVDWTVKVCSVSAGSPSAAAPRVLRAEIVPSTDGSWKKGIAP